MKIEVAHWSSTSSADLHLCQRALALDTPDLTRTVRAFHAQSVQGGKSPRGVKAATLLCLLNEMYNMTPDEIEDAIDAAEDREAKQADAEREARQKAAEQAAEQAEAQKRADVAAFVAGRERRKADAAQQIKTERDLLVAEVAARVTATVTKSAPNPLDSLLAATTAHTAALNAKRRTIKTQVRDAAGIIQYVIEETE